MFRFMLRLEACVGRMPNTLKMRAKMSESGNPQFMDTLNLNLFWSDFKMYLHGW